MNTALAAHLAHDLMQQHGLLPDWTFAFDNAKSRFGYCDYGKKRLSLSRHLTELNDEGQVQDTILHEIAHALAGPQAGHGRVWKAMALAVGCNGRRCYGAETVTPPKKYIGTCPTCGCKVERHKRLTISCSQCDPNFNLKHLFTWERA